MNNLEEQNISKQLDREKAKERAAPVKHPTLEIDKTSEAAEEAEAINPLEQAQKVMKMINLIGSGSGVGIIVTFFTMNAQAFFGNLMKLPFVPRLGKIEIFALLTVDFLVFISLLIIYLFFSILTMVYTDPLGTLWTFAKEGLGGFWEMIKDGLGL